ncbi:MAG: DUF2155 domain-containing protein [Geminicoccaceae bacterium]|nr:DUF2155 domain-containing protein [Geminicoccaceae bacterium]
MRRSALAVLLVLFPGAAATAAPSVPYRIVVLQALDKVTARVSELELPVGGEVAFGTLKIRASACLETPPTEPPESAAFLRIDAEAPKADAGTPAGGGSPKPAFSGWMFASSPAVSALENPVYDVWVLDCREPLADTPLPAGAAPNVTVPRPADDAPAAVETTPLPPDADPED